MILRTSVSNHETVFATGQMLPICKPLGTGLPFVGSTSVGSCLFAVLLNTKKDELFSFIFWYVSEIQTTLTMFLGRSLCFARVVQLTGWWPRLSENPGIFLQPPDLCTRPQKGACCWNVRRPPGSSLRGLRAPGTLLSAPTARPEATD